MFCSPANSTSESSPSFDKRSKTGSASSLKSSSSIPGVLGLGDGLSGRNERQSWEQHWDVNSKKKEWKTRTSEGRKSGQKKQYREIDNVKEWE